MDVIAFPAAVPDAAERALALDIDRSWITEAPAGSGKTGLLIQRFLKLLGTVDDPAEVLALTFTQKATAEMRDRVLGALRDAESKKACGPDEFQRLTRALAERVLQQDAARHWQLLHRPHLLNIRTIDSLCSNIARAVPLLSGSGGVSRPVGDAQPLYRRAAHAVMMRLGGEDEALNSAIRTVLLHRDGDLSYCEQVLAGMLGTREQWGRLVPLSRDVLSDSVLDGEVLPRLNEALGRTVCAALTTLHHCFPEAELEQIADLMRELSFSEGYKGAESSFAPCAHYRGSPGSQAADLDHWLLVARLLLTKEGGWRQSFSANHLGAQIEKTHSKRAREIIESIRSDELGALLCAVRELPPAVYPREQWVVAKALFRLLHHAVLELKLLFAAEEACDFNEIALAARAALESESEDVHAAMGTPLRHLLVDEMQDTSSSQYELLRLLTAEWDGRKRTVFLVGDPKQSIYLFRQARVDLFQKCIQEGRMGQIPVGVLQLTSNFRSGRHIVSQFNEAFTLIFPADVVEAGDVTYADAHAIRGETLGEGMHWHLEQLPHYKDTAIGRTQREGAVRREAAAIGTEIQSLRQENAAASIAVLTRARSHVAQVTRVLAEAGIPYRAVEMDPLGERQEVLDMLAVTRALLHPADRTAWFAVLRAPWCGAGLGDLHTLAAGDQPVHKDEAPRLRFRDRAVMLDDAMRQRVLRTLDVLDGALSITGALSLAEVVERAWRSLGGDACTDETGRENVRQYLRVLDEMEAEGEAVDSSSLDRRLKRLFAAPDPTPCAVDVMTIHKAKGLEWDAVFVPGLHRTSAASGYILLDWLELPTQDGNGVPDVILAPLPGKGNEPGTLNTYIRSSRKRLATAEVKRLFYVAATRARTSLHLLAWPDTRSDGDIINRVGTLLKAAERAARQHLAPETSAAAQEAAQGAATPEESFAMAAAADEPVPRQKLPAIRRLPSGYDPLERLRRQTAPQADAFRAAVAQENSDGRAFQRPEGSYGARVVGKAIHAFTERLTEQLAERTAAGAGPDDAALELHGEIEGWASAIRATLRAGGMPASALDRAQRNVQRGLKNLLQNEQCRWVILPHTAAASEAALRSAEDGSTVRVRLDRTFLAGEKPGAQGSDTLWIVDFKTADHAAPGLDTFLEQERSKYTGQLRTYAEVLLRTRPEPQRVMLGLCYPLIGRLMYWPHEEVVAGQLPAAAGTPQTVGKTGQFNLF